jgi:hypothetical protein
MYFKQEIHGDLKEKPTYKTASVFLYSCGSPRPCFFAAFG